MPIPLAILCGRLTIVLATIPRPYREIIPASDLAFDALYLFDHAMINTANIHPPQDQADSIFFLQKIADPKDVTGQPYPLAFSQRALG